MAAAAGRRRLAVLIDLSGTLHVEDAATQDGVQALQRLRRLPQVGNRIRFVTNTTKESGSLLLARLAKLGYDVQTDELHTSLTAAKRLIVQRGLRPMLLLEECAMEDFRDLDTSSPDSVVVGLAPSQFHYERLNDAFRLLLERPNAPLIAIHKGRYYKRADGLALGPGPFVQALEYATGAQAVVVGKPENEFYASALRSVAAQCGEEGVWPPDQAIMIGDDWRDDALGALEAGLRAVLVRTGKYRPDDERRLPQTDRVHCCDSFADAVGMIESGQIA